MKNSFEKTVSEILISRQPGTRPVEGAYCEAVMVRENEGCISVWFSKPVCLRSKTSRKVKAFLKLSFALLKDTTVIMVDDFGLYESTTTFGDNVAHIVEALAAKGEISL